MGADVQDVEMRMPILLVVDEDQAALEALSADLGRRFGADYEIQAESSPTRAMAVLQQLADESRPVALVFASQQMTEVPGAELVAAARRLHPAVRRILRLERGDYTIATETPRMLTNGTTPSQ